MKRHSQAHVASLDLGAQGLFFNISASDNSVTATAKWSGRPLLVMRSWWPLGETSLKTAFMPTSTNNEPWIVHATGVHGRLDSLFPDGQHVACRQALGDKHNRVAFILSSTSKKAVDKYSSIVCRTAWNTCGAWVGHGKYEGTAFVLDDSRILSDFVAKPQCFFNSWRQSPNLHLQESDSER